MTDEHRRDYIELLKIVVMIVKMKDSEGFDHASTFTTRNKQNR